jgi:hypothetical protein
MVDALKLVKALEVLGQATLRQLEAASALGRYASMGGSIDAIKASGAAAETYLKALLESQGFRTFNVQRANGTGFDLISAKIAADGSVSDVMKLDVKNTAGLVDSITAFGAGAKRAGNYQGNVASAIKQLIAMKDPAATAVAVALRDGDFGVALVAHPSAQIAQSVYTTVTKQTGKQLQFLGYLP